jgi:hypothetical protein
MKKIPFLFLILLATASLAFAQKKTASLDDVWALFNTNFTKFPYVHQIQAENTDDNRTAKIEITTLPYTKGENFDGTPILGEMVYIMIRQGGFRYDMKFDFVSEKEKGARGSLGVKNSVWKFLSSLHPPLEKKADATENSGS